MKYKNKSNLEILQNYVDGIRPFTQIGYTGNKYIKRSVGDVWVDNKGIKWEQKESGPVRINEVANIIKSSINYKCRCGQDIRYGNKRDNIFFYRTGLCENCLIDYENKLHILGIYPDYEKYKVLSNDVAHLKEIKEKLKDVIKFFSNNSGDVEMVCNSEGFVERWKNVNREQIIKDTTRDLKLVNKRITFLTKHRNEYKQKFIALSKQYKLDIYGTR